MNEFTEGNILTVYHPAERVVVISIEVCSPYILMFKGNPKKNKLKRSVDGAD